MPRHRFFVLVLLCLSVAGAPPAAAAPPASPAPEAQVQELKDTVQITGVGAARWKLVYGKLLYAPKYWHPLLVQAEGHRAWFGYGAWLRLIDTQKGQVIGRWHFSWGIVRLAPSGTQVTVDTEDRNEYDKERPVVHRSERLDPAAPPRPGPLEAENLIQYRQAENEVSRAFFSGSIDAKEMTPAVVKKLLPALEEQMRRDPFSPWYRVYYWRALEIAQDKRAATALSGVAPGTSGTDFTELLGCSAALTRWSNHYAASLYFESGYRDFIQHGYDPRLWMALITRMMVYNPSRWDLKLSAAEQQTVIDRIYRLTPNGEFAWAAWEQLAKQAAAEGRTSDATLWQARARAAEAASGAYNLRFLTRADRALLSEVAALLALVLFFLVAGAHYSQQHRAEIRAQQPRPSFFRRLSFFNVKYWTRAQRVGFFGAIVLFWMVVGYARTYEATFLRFASSPMTSLSGSLAGERARDHLATLPAGPERDLMIAVSDQQSGDAAKAEAEYRALPQFAESWNNLGALLAAAGKPAEARQAYERALQIDPALPEAQANLGRPVENEWVKIHQEYLPSQAMLAVPSGRQIRDAYRGSREYRLRQVLEGPFAGGEGLARMVRYLDESPPVLEVPGGTVAQVVYLLVLLASLALLLRRPRPVSRPGGKISAFFEVLCPGTNPTWGVLGGVAAITWIYLLIQALLLHNFGTPYILTSMVFPNTMRLYGVQADGMGMTMALGPTKLVGYGTPLLLFVINLVMVIRQRKMGATAR